jgi:hypothetical protein
VNYGVRHSLVSSCFAPERVEAKGRRLALALLMFLAGCGGVAPAPSPAPQARRPSAEPLRPEAVRPRFWLRLENVSPFELEKAWHHPPRALVVERMDDGRLRPIDADLPPTGLTPRLLEKPTQEDGLGLYAQRAAELHLGALEGPVIARVSAGTFVPIVEWGARATRVASPLHSESDPFGPLVRAFVDSGALGLKGGSAPAVAETVTPYADYIDWDMPLRLGPHDEPFAETPCGPMRVLVRDGAQARIAQDIDGFHMEGWITAPRERVGSHRCEPRVIAPREVSEEDASVPSPAGYVPFIPDATVDARVVALFHGRGTLYWLIDRGGRFTCDAWTVVPRRPPENLDDREGLVGELRQFDNHLGRREVVSFGLLFGPHKGRRPAVISLTGPSESGPNGGVALCGQLYAILSLHDNALTMLRGEYPVGLFGYRTEDTDTWYLTRPSCEAAAREIAATPSLADAGFVRRGCD